MTGTPPTAVQRVLDLLPVHVRARDEASGGLLAALAEAVGAELGLLESDIETLYASWFVETCPEWVVPYIADLVGVADLPPDLAAAGAPVSRRAIVANTVAYRRRKGTVAVIEEVARDATGWPARAVEYFRLLAASSHVNHVRTDRPATAGLRTPPAAGGPLDLVRVPVAQGALDPLAHTADVRHIASGRGRYGIGNVGVYLFTDQVYEVGDPALTSPDASGWAPAGPPPGTDRSAGWTVHPLGLDSPLYAVPDPEPVIERLAAEPDLPVPMRPRRLLTLLAAARALGSAAGLPLAVRVDGEVLGPDRVRVHGLEDRAAGRPGDPAFPELSGWQVFADPVTGRLHPYLAGVPAAPERLETMHCYGGTADVGAGTYDRTAVHSDVLAADAYRGDPARGGPGCTAQRSVVTPDPPVPGATPLADELALAESAWAAPDSPAGGTYVIAIGDSASYTGDLSVHVPASTRLVLVAAIGVPDRDGRQVPGLYGSQGVRPRLAGSLTVTGDGGGSLVLDGLVVQGDVLIGPGHLGSVAVSQCTIAGTLRVGSTGGAADPGIAVRLVRSVCGPVRFGSAAAGLDVQDSVVDAVAFGPPGPPPGPAGPVAVSGAGLALGVTGSTIRGQVQARTLAASSAVLDGQVEVENRQTGCVRYSFVPPGSRVPRRYRCAPADGADAALRPVYASRSPGSPWYAALAPGCPVAIAGGGEGGAEMGVHHHLQRPARLAAASRLLAPYVPVGLEIGVAAPLATGRS